MRPTCINKGWKQTKHERPSFFIAAPACSVVHYGLCEMCSDSSKKCILHAPIQKCVQIHSYGQISNLCRGFHLGQSVLGLWAKHLWMLRKLLSLNVTLTYLIEMFYDATTCCLRTSSIFVSVKSLLDVVSELFCVFMKKRPLQLHASIHLFRDSIWVFFSVSMWMKTFLEIVPCLRFFFKQQIKYCLGKLLYPSCQDSLP